MLDLLLENYLLAVFLWDDPVYYMPTLAQETTFNNLLDFSCSILILDVPYVVYYRVVSMCITYAGSMAEPSAPCLSKSCSRFSTEFDFALSKDTNEMRLHVDSSNAAKALSIISAMMHRAEKFSMEIVLPGKEPMRYVKAKALGLRPWFA